MSIRVLLIEDHFLARMALRSVLNGHGDIELVAEASDGASGVEMYRQCAPDVTVMDLRLPGLSGFDAISAIRKLCKTARIAVLSNYEGSEDIYRAIRNGAMAYLKGKPADVNQISAFTSKWIIAGLPAGRFPGDRFRKGRFRKGRRRGWERRAAAWAAAAGSRSRAARTSLAPG